MAELRVTKLDDALMVKIKAGAAVNQTTIRAFVVTLLMEALRRREGRKRP